MSAETDIAIASQPEENSGTAALFVSLYVVVLAFFILLTSNASFDKHKSEKVMESVNKAFAPDINAQLNFNTQQLGATAGIEQLFDTLQTTIISVVPLYEMKISVDDRVMRVTMADTALFNENSPHLRPERQEFYDRLVSVLTQWQENATIDLDFLQGVKRPNRASPEAAATLQVARAGNFARFMENKGITPSTLSVGIDPTLGSQISFTFSVVEMRASPARKTTIIAPPKAVERKQP